MKRIRGFDEKLAFKAMKKRVENIGYYKDLGFIPFRSRKTTGVHFTSMEGNFLEVV